MKSYVTRAGVVSALGCSLLVSSLCYGTENGDTVWPLGVQTVLPAILPPPGETSLYSYTAYYKADSFKDNSGKSSVPGFSLENFVQAIRVVHTWDVKFDSGVTLSSGIIGSANKIKVEAFGKEHSFTILRTRNHSSHFHVRSPIERRSIERRCCSGQAGIDYNVGETAFAVCYCIHCLVDLFDGEDLLVEYRKIQGAGGSHFGHVLTFCHSEPEGADHADLEAHEFEHRYRQILRHTANIHHAAAAAKRTNRLNGKFMRSARANRIDEDVSTELISVLPNPITQWLIADGNRENAIWGESAYALQQLAVSGHREDFCSTHGQGKQDGPKS